MAISGGLRVSAALTPYNFNPLRVASHFPPSKIDCNAFSSFASRAVEPRFRTVTVLNPHTTRCQARRPLELFKQYNLSQNPLGEEIENFLINVIHMNFFERLNLAWKIMFPSPSTQRNSNANIAKQRLKMILFSDRCAVSDAAKEKIVSNVVSALSDFVEIESQDKVQLSVSTDPDLGTIYSVTVPVRRVRSQYQVDNETGTITNIEYRDTRDVPGSVDVNFDFYVPGDESMDSGTLS